MDAGSLSEMAVAMRTVSLPVEVAVSAGAGAAFGAALGGEEGKKAGFKLAAGLFIAAELAPPVLMLLAKALS